MSIDLHACRGSRIVKIADAVSQLLNVAVLPNCADTDANESISGRAYRCGWTRTERFINALFPGDPDHCRMAYLRDIQRSRDSIDRHEREGR